VVGALLVAVAVALAGSPVAIAAALLAAVVLAGLGLVGHVLERRLMRRAQVAGRATIWEVPAPPEPKREAASEAQDDRMAPNPTDDLTTATPATVPTAPVARDLALEAVRELHAPAAAVLVPRGRRLVPAASAGDWALARRIQREQDAAAAPPGTSPVSAASATGSENGDEPPEFPLDDFLPRLLGLYPRAVPFERWHELGDVPPALLPLVALADRGAAVAVTLRHRRRLAGLWVLGRRSGGRTYSDAELGRLERLAQRAAPALAKAMNGDE
jgi:hypothetical protein